MPALGSLPGAANLLCVAEGKVGHLDGAKQLRCTEIKKMAEQALYLSNPPRLPCEFFSFLEGSGTRREQWARKQSLVILRLHRWQILGICQRCSASV